MPTPGDGPSPADPRQPRWAVPDETRQWGALARNGVAQQGLYGDRKGVYTYMDSEASLGVIFELLESFKEPR